LLLLCAPCARAESGSIAFPFGARFRHAEPDATNSVEAMFAATLNLAQDGKSFATHALGALGSDGSRATGTFAYSMAYGVVLGESGEVTQGLSLRGGVDVLVDSVGGLKASYLSLPLLEAGYTYGNAYVQFDLGAQAAPVLAGRLRLDDSVRRMGLGAKAGPYVNLLLPQIGISLRLSADHLIASTTSGGASDWAQGLLCFNVAWLDACADGFAARFAETENTPKKTMGYAGISLGVNLVKSSKLVYTGPR
jgi:hypothetical protein